MVRVRFQPLQIHKKRWRQRWGATQPREDDIGDIEKRGLLDETSKDETRDCTDSSRSSSGSHDSAEAVLRDQTSHNAFRSARAYAPRRRSQRKCNRWFTIGLATTLVSFFFLLFQLAFSSARQVAQGTRRPEPKPPPWQEFPILHRYYGGIRGLVEPENFHSEYPGDPEALAEDVVNSMVHRGADDAKVLERADEEAPIPASRHFVLNTTRDTPARCFGNGEQLVEVPPLQSYEGFVQGFPQNAFGSFDLLGLGSSHCFDRFGRLGPYGYGYDKESGGIGAGQVGDRDGADQVWAETPEADFSNTHWASILARCTQTGSKKLESRPEKTKSPIDRSFRRDVDEDKIEPSGSATHQPTSSLFLIRTDTDHNYTPEELLHFRSLMLELTLASGSKNSIHFLIQVRDESLQVWSDESTYQDVLDRSLPEEFHGMGTLWSERQMALVYGNLEQSHFRDQSTHSNERGHFLAVQHFAHRHPEFDFIWNLPTDVRYTGHWLSLVDSSSQWARKQPRKHLWERNGRFYIPSEHGEWEDFRQMVRVQTEHGMQNSESLLNKLGVEPNQVGGDVPSSMISKVEIPVWGPKPPSDADVDATFDVLPPTTREADTHKWGVDEDADLVTFNPIFDPDNTGWTPATDFTGYNVTANHPPPPRRATVGTMMRLSRRLLETMHRETALHRRHMHSAMWPSSCALHHGLKAVYVPHPVYVDRKWPTDYLAAVFNGGGNGAVGGARSGVIGDASLHNFNGLSWGIFGLGDDHGDFAGRLWKRWVGLRAAGEGGEEYELAGEGRMCLPPMLLGPVKDIHLPGACMK